MSAPRQITDKLKQKVTERIRNLFPKEADVNIEITDAIDPTIYPNGLSSIHVGVDQDWFEASHEQLLKYYHRLNAFGHGQFTLLLSPELLQALEDQTEYDNLKKAIASSHEDQFKKQGNIAYERGYQAEKAKDYSQARSSYEEAAKYGHVKAKTNLASLYLRGLGGPKDSARAYDLYLEPVKEGNSRAQYNLARMFENGDGVPKDLFMALKWYEICLNNTNTIEKDKTEARKKIVRIDQELTQQMENEYQADNELPKKLFSKGYEAEKKEDYVLAKIYYEQSENLGFIQAKEYLGGLHITGKIPQDPKRAFSLLSQAAEGGRYRAQFNLARMFEKGIGTDVDLKLARHWYEKAWAGAKENKDKQTADRAQEKMQLIDEKLMTEQIANVDLAPRSK